MLTNIGLHFNSLNTMPFMNDLKWAEGKIFFIVNYIILPVFILAMTIAFVRLVMLSDTEMIKSIGYRAFIICFLLVAYKDIWQLSYDFVTYLTDYFVSDPNNPRVSRKGLVLMAIERARWTYNFQDFGIGDLVKFTFYQSLFFNILCGACSIAIWIVSKIRDHLLALCYIVAPLLISVSFFENFYLGLKSLAKTVLIILMWYFVFHFFLVTIFPADFCQDVIHMNYQKRQENIELYAELIKKMFYLTIVATLVAVLTAFVFAKQVTSAEGLTTIAVISTFRTTTRALNRLTNSIRGNYKYLSKTASKELSSSNNNSSSVRVYSSNPAGSSSAFNNARIPKTKL